MIGLLLNITPCNQPDILKIVMIIMTAVKVVFTIIPIVIILYVLIDLFKNVIANKEDEMKSGVKLAIKRIIYGIVIFFIPTIVLTVNNILGDLGVKYSECLENATKEGIAKARANYNAYQEELQSKINSNINTNEDKTVDGNTSTKSTKGFNNLKSGEKDSSTTDEKNDSNLTDKAEEYLEEKNDTTSNTEQDKTTSTNNKILFVGDSRTNGMCKTIGLKDECIAKDSQGYKWLHDTADAKIKEKVNSGYNVVIINLGVNDFANINSYITYYNNFIEKYKAKLIVSSVTQINDSLAKKNHYNVKNEQVIIFNKRLQAKLNENITYCDVYNNTLFKRNFETIDGIHYTSDTYKKIYNILRNCV